MVIFIIKPFTVCKSETDGVFFGVCGWRGREPIARGHMNGARGKNYYRYKSPWRATFAFHCVFLFFFLPNLHHLDVYFWGKIINFFNKTWKNLQLYSRCMMEYSSPLSCPYGRRMSFNERIKGVLVESNLSNWNISAR